MSLQSYQETLVTAQVDGTAITAAAAASAIPAAAKFLLPANYFAIGKQLLVEASGRISSVITTPGTARFDIRFGVTVVFDGLAALLDTAAAHSTKGWFLRVLLTCRAIGTAGNLMGQGTWTAENLIGTGVAPTGSPTAMLPWNSTPAVGNNFDTTATQVVDLFFTQTVATGTMTLHQYSLISLN